MPYPYGMQSAPAVGNGLGGLPRRQADAKEPLIYEVLSKGRRSNTVRTFEVPPGYSRMRVTINSRGGISIGNPVYGGGKAISPVLQARAGQKIEINLVAGVNSDSYTAAGNTSTVTIGALVMTATDAGYQTAGTATGGEQNLTGTRYGVGGINDSTSTDIGAISDTNYTLTPEGASPGAPAGSQQNSGGGTITLPGGQAMVRIILW
ncbi:hypothetical protein [Pseudomonas oryzihabitans]|uniref:hypothetical protein n=1 Tax=Pseudomonas oryzihabitans TaxID=47885 RepID=UPI002898F9B9|nr:hypothetical protein [Pseudomonas oryzihabitans]